MATGILAPNAKYYINDACGNPAVGGWMITLDAITNLPRPTYADVGLTIPNPIKMFVGTDGAVQGIQYWDVDSGYYTILEFDASGTLITRVTPYPYTDGSGGGNVTVVTNAENFGENEQFAFWPCGTSFTNADLPVGVTPVATMWSFRRSNTNATVILSQYVFSAGVNSVPFSPGYAFRYQVTSPSADTTNDWLQRYNDVQTLNNEIITVAVQVATNVALTTATISLYIRQNFGVGGSPEIETVIDSFVATDSFALYPFTFTVPPIGGNTIGTGSYLEIGYRYNPTLTQDVLLTNYQFQTGTGTGAVFPYVTENLQYVKVLPETLAGHCPNTGTDIIGTGSISTPAAQTLTLTEYLQESFFETKTNMLIGWNFYTNPNQFGKTFASVNNATYIADQTILLSDGDGIVSKDSFIGDPLKLTVLITGKKFGIFQIIETINSSMIIDTLISLATGLFSSADSTMKMAVLGWNGTADMQALDCIDAWNALGSDPTLIAGWNYLETPLEFTSTVTPTYFKQEAIDSGDIYSSYGVIIWCDGGDLPVTNELVYEKIALVEGINATDAENLPFETVLRQSQRYFQKSFSYQDLSYPLVTGETCALSVSPNAALGLGATYPIYPVTSDNSTLNLSTAINQIQFYTEMWNTPTVTIYNPDTTVINSSTWNVVLGSGTFVGGSTNIVTTAANPSTKGFELVNNAGSVSMSSISSVAYQPDLIFHYVANATLGV